MNEKDTYKTLVRPAQEVLFKEKNSKFFGYAYPIEEEEQAKELLEQLKKQHHSARHWCYAWQLGKLPEHYQFRANDDGEPNNSAGMPIYGQIQSFEVTDVLVVVVRYFGGVKLGVGGLITAYKTTAQMALEQADIETRTINQPIELKSTYAHLNKIMRVIKEKNLEVVHQTLELDCKVVIQVRLGKLQETLGVFNSIYGVEVKLPEV